MSIYAYECMACGDTFDHVQSMASGRLRKCKKCGKHKLAQLISRGTGLIFRGTGFHCNDYPKGKSK